MSSNDHINKELPRPIFLGNFRQVQDLLFQHTTNSLADPKSPPDKRDTNEPEDATWSPISLQMEDLPGFPYPKVPEISHDVEHVRDEPEELANTISYGSNFPNIMNMVSLRSMARFDVTPVFEAPRMNSQQQLKDNKGYQTFTEENMNFRENIWDLINIKELPEISHPEIPKIPSDLLHVNHESEFFDPEEISEPIYYGVDYFSNIMSEVSVRSSHTDVTRVLEPPLKCAQQHAKEMALKKRQTLFGVLFLGGLIFCASFLLIYPPVKFYLIDGGLHKKKTVRGCNRSSYLALNRPIPNGGNLTEPDIVLEHLIGLITYLFLYFL